MIGSEAGVYLTFYNEGESRELELPALGPFEMLVVRRNRLIGQRETVEHDLEAAGTVQRWLEAELELRRAHGEEPEGPRHSHMRIRAPRNDILVRFFDYSGDQPPAMPELGPFQSLSIGRREVRADDKLLATRASEIAPWTLTDAIRPGVAGVLKADFSVFTATGGDPTVKAAASSEPAPEPAPDIAPVGEPSAALTFAPRPRSVPEIFISRPTAPHAEPELTPNDVRLIERVEQLRAADLTHALMVERLRKEQHVDPEEALRPQDPISSRPMRFGPPVDERAEEVDEEIPLGERLRELAWSGRYAIMALLVGVVVLSGIGYLRSVPPTAGAGQAQAVRIVELTERVANGDWVFLVDAVERPRRLGGIAAQQGSYLVIYVLVTKKNGDAPELDPGDFALVDAGGNQSPAFRPNSDLYSAATGLTWPARFPVNASARVPLVFDVNPGARDLRLLMRRAAVEVRLPN